MVKNKAVNDRYRKEVDNYNKYFGDFEKVKRFELVDREWTIDEGEVTPSLWNYTSKSNSPRNAGFKGGRAKSPEKEKKLDWFYAR